MLFISGWVAHFEQNQHHWVLPKNLIRQAITLQGVVASIPLKTQFGESFIVAITQIKGKKTSARIRLGWYDAKAHVMAGQKWRLSVKLKPPNPLARQPKRFAAVGYVVRKGDNRLLTQQTWQYPLTYCRQYIQQQVLIANKNPHVAAVISALTVGSRAAMSRHEWAVFQATGTSHLMAISGLHVGLVATVAFIIFSTLWKISTRALLMLPASSAGAMGAIICAFLYSLMAGFAVPTQRAFIMIAVLMLAQLCFRATPVWRRLLLAFVIVIAFNPASLTTPSLWLSFSAVAWITYGMRGDPKNLTGWRAWLKLQWVLCLGLAPITLFFFQQLSLGMYIANLVAIPWVSFLVVPAALVGVLCLLISHGLALKVFWLAGMAFLPMWWWLQWLASLPGVVWFHALPNVWVFILSMIGVIALLSQCRRLIKAIGLLILIFSLLIKAPKPPEKAIWLTVLNVGQGLAVLIRTHDHVLLYDAGPSMYGGYDAGRSVVVPFLHKMSVSHLDRIVISHPHIDHYGGLAAVKRFYPKAPVVTTQKSRRLKRWHPAVCHIGEHWQWDGVRFTFLYPPGHLARTGKVNETSCVLKVTNGQGSVLLPGDIERQGEQWLLKNERKQLPSEVIVAAHHGSDTSSDSDLIQLVAPKYAVFATGFYNRFKFPAKSVVRTFQKVGAKMYNTAVNGSINVRISPGGQVTLAADREIEPG